VKFSIRQILASAAGAVIAAVIASSFGVKGTIVGVAIGSAAATMATALVAQSIERGHEAVKQVVVRAPETSTLLRKLGSTGASGGTAASASTAPMQVVGQSGADDGGTAETVPMESVGSPVGESERLEISAVADAPGTERLRATTTPMRPASRPGLRRFSWKTITATAAIVFVLALLFITAIELISGEPLSAIFGGSDTGTTLSNLGGTPVAPTTTPTTSTPSTTSSTSSSSTTTTTSATTTTSTTVPTSNSTTTTTSATTTTSTTTAVRATSTTTSQPLP
jgi:hypothetical protein